jgi:hypothetical protein
MSFLTFVWQASRQWSFICLRLKKTFSVGKMSPPPSMTCARAARPPLPPPPPGGGGEEDVAALKGSEQGAADGRFDFFFAVDGQLDVARRHELGFCNQQQYDQQQHDDEKHRYAGSDRQS